MQPHLDHDHPCALLHLWQGTFGGRGALYCGWRGDWPHWWLCTDRPSQVLTASLRIEDT